MSLTYSDYLCLPDLLSLQQPKSDPEEHDEMLFIVIHQVHELWFKLMLHELEKIRQNFFDADLYGALATFKRARMILKTVVVQVDILETLTPVSFSSFRSRLETSSGFQSVQFREIEFLLGYRRPDLLKYHPEASEGHRQLQARLEEPSVSDAFQSFLAQRGANLSSEEAFHESLLKLYRQQKDLQLLLELMTDFDEGFQEWRYRHVKLVERTIGSKQGTGGSLGVEFLKQSLFLPLFPDLWAIRHRM